MSDYRQNCSPRVGILINRIRVEEKQLIRALESRGVEYETLHDGDLQFYLNEQSGWNRFDVILERSISHSRAVNALRIFRSAGVPTVNSMEVAATCGDKIRTSLALEEAGVPQPESAVAFTPDSALEAIEQVGYPVVLKPVTGSWGRLMTRVEDRETARSVLEHKQTLGGVQHSIFFIQKYVEKGGSDIRAFVVGDETICAIERRSDHWITNTARGAEVSPIEVTPDLHNICIAAANAVGGGVLAVDLFTSEGEFLVNEVNYTMEFRNSTGPTGVNIPGKIVDYVIEIARNRGVRQDRVPMGAGV